MKPTPKLILILATVFGIHCAEAQQMKPIEPNANFKLWPAMISTTHPNVSPSGDYVASRTIFLKIWKINHAVPESLEWESNVTMPGYFPVVYSWAQNDLIVSRVKKDGILSFKEAYRETGDTVLVRLDKKEIVTLIPKAYRTIVLSKSGKVMAAMSPTGDSSKSNQNSIDFYSVDAKNKTAKLIGTWRKTIEEDSKGLAKLITWSQDETGVFVSIPERYYSKDDHEQVEKPGLYFVSPSGEEKSVIPEFAWMVSQSPYPIATKESQLFSFIDYFGQTSYLTKINRQGIQESVLWREIRDIIRDKNVTLKVQNPRILALAPNGRIVIIQDMGQDEDQDYLRLRQIWAVDLKTRKRRKLGLASQLSAKTWCKYGLLTGLFDKQFQLESVYGILNCQEALLDADSPELQKLIDAEPWESKPQ